MPKKPPEMSNLGMRRYGSHKRVIRVNPVLKGDLYIDTSHKFEIAKDGSFCFDFSNDRLLEFEVVTEHERSFVRLKSPEAATLSYQEQALRPHRKSEGTRVSIPQKGPKSRNKITPFDVPRAMAKKR